MRRVVKGESPAEFERWKADANADWQPSYKCLRNPEKQIVHRALLAEQGHVCCYCGREISECDSHIEHFLPQHAFASRALDYENLLASCLRQCGSQTPLHCGHAKADALDGAKAISPLEADCECRFKYTFGGAIVPSDESDGSATYMRDLLVLDGAALRSRRAEVLSRVFDVDFLATATVEELISLRDGFGSRDENGRYASFGHVVARFADQRMMECVAV